MTFADGKRKVVTVADWKDRRAEILALEQKYDIGTIPPRPKLDQIITIDPAVAAAEAAAGALSGGRFGRGGAASEADHRAWPGIWARQRIGWARSGRRTCRRARGLWPGRITAGAGVDHSGWLI